MLKCNLKISQLQVIHDLLLLVLVWYPHMCFKKVSITYLLLLSFAIQHRAKKKIWPCPTLEIAISILALLTLLLFFCQSLCPLCSDAWIIAKQGQYVVWQSVQPELICKFTTKEGCTDCHTEPCFVLSHDTTLHYTVILIKLTLKSLKFNVFFSEQAESQP